MAVAPNICKILVEISILSASYKRFKIGSARALKPMPQGMATRPVTFTIVSIFFLISIFSFLVHAIAKTGNAETPITDVIVGTKLYKVKAYPL